jgi:Phosphoserine phosphatase RsbU, N-terminal domain
VTETHDLRVTTHSFRAVYRRALEQHVATPGEATLRDAYELGRAGIALELTVLDLAIAHHEALRASLQSTHPDEVGDLLVAAADFLAEALTASEMVRRGYVEIREAERRQREDAALVRRLSALLADTSLAAHGRDALTEMIQLVAEHARELTQAVGCAVVVDGRAWPRAMKAVSADGESEDRSAGPDLVIPLTSLDGSQLGRIELWTAAPGGFSELQRAFADHLAQMTSAALDRAQLYSQARREA